MNITDGELLRRYASERSEAAFGELVRRHVNLVYSAALRQVNGDADLAEDVTQTIFTDLARKAGRLARHTSLSGWLYTSTRFLATNIRRAEHRRRDREREAHTMSTLLQPVEPEPDWARLRPLLDDAMHALDEEDRMSVLLRHFEHRSFAEIGARVGLSENAARMRVERAVEKLRAGLSKRGVTSTAGALAELLAANAIGAAPPHLGASVTRKALAGTAAMGGLSALLTQLLVASRIKLAAAGIALVAVVAIGVAFWQTGSPLSRRLVQTSAEAPANPTAGIPGSEGSMTNIAAAGPGTRSVTKGSSLHLQIVTADSGKPVPLVQVVPLRGSGRGLSQPSDLLMDEPLVADHMGVCSIVYPGDTTWLQIALRLDGFADTRLDWSPDRGDAIPENYVVRLDRAVPIGGRVVDPDGNPVADAKVTWGQGNDFGMRKPPQYHELLDRHGRIETSSIEITTDAEGRWHLDRIAADVLPGVWGFAQHTNYVDCAPVDTRKDLNVEKQLREGTFTFKLGRGVIARGIVVDANGTPISGAKVGVGSRSDSRHREAETQSDGTFATAGCEPGKQMVTAEAAGYAPTALATELSAESEPVRLVLGKGTLLRLRVVDKAGNPLRWAHAALNTWADPRRPTPVQATFMADADTEGRIIWTNAPDEELTFDIRASHCMSVSGTRIRPDGEEHVVVLPPTLSLHGTVQAESNGKPIPKFRIVTGWSESDPVSGMTNVQWSVEGRFRFECSGGKYQCTFEDPVASWKESREYDYIFKFEADGYATWISRTIASDEGNVQLDAALRSAPSISVTVLKPGGQTAGLTVVGLVSPGVQLVLSEAGFLRGNASSASSLVITDSSGQFELRPDSSITQVLAASPEGYAEATPAALSDNPILQLQPWGRLAVTCLAGGKPATERDYQLEFSGGAFDTISFDPKLKVTTDAQGTFLVSQMPPGQHVLTRGFRDAAMLTFETWAPGDKTTFESSPGETTAITVGRSNCSVTARLVWPAGIQRQAQWHIYAHVQTPMPKPPETTGTNEAARAAFYQSAEYQTARQSMRQYPAIPREDGTLVAEEVEPGNYELAVTILEFVDQDPRSPGHRFGSKRILEGSALVTVPTDPPTGTLDAGIIGLESPVAAR